MKKYINFNTEKNNECGINNELMINSVYGKTMENLRNRINVRLTNNLKGFFKIC